MNWHVHARCMPGACLVLHVHLNPTRQVATLYRLHVSLNSIHAANLHVLSCAKHARVCSQGDIMQLTTVIPVPPETYLARWSLLVKLSMA
jgi:hypothetical protein